MFARTRSILLNILCLRIGVMSGTETKSSALNGNPGLKMIYTL